jgi:long-chain acyl-CoA synthetase
LRGGWLHSGDAGLVDRDGYLTMRGRFAELIEVGGKTWFPRDVEEALCAQAGIREAAVIGLPDAALGQRPIAYVTTDGDGIDLAGLKAAIAKSLTAKSVPYDLSALTLVRLAAFPMTPTGKIAKAELRERAMAPA